jgi:DNA-binding protein YbaB
MTSPYQDQIDAAMAQFQQQRARLRDTRAEMEKLTASASSKDHLVTVVVGPAGEVREIRFSRTDYARMAPAELAAVLVETIAKAREKAAAEVRKGFEGLAGFGADLRDSLAGGEVLDELFGELAEPAAPAPTRFTVSEEDDLDG